MAHLSAQLAARFAASAGTKPIRLIVNEHFDAIPVEVDRRHIFYKSKIPCKMWWSLSTEGGDHLGVHSSSLYRFRWLSWLAGLLSGEDQKPLPEMTFWNNVVLASTVSKRRNSDTTQFDDLSERCRRYLTRINATKPLPRKSGNWKAIAEKLKRLADDFKHAGLGSPWIDVALVSIPDPTENEKWFAKQQAMCRRWIELNPNGDVVALSGLVGENKAVRSYAKLSSEAVSLLPIELTLNPPLFPTINPFTNRDPCGFQQHDYDASEIPSGWWAWTEFLYVVSLEFNLQIDHPVNGARIARLSKGTSPFNVASRAIDAMQSCVDGWEYIDQFRRQLVMTCPWFDDDDREIGVNVLDIVQSRGRAHVVKESKERTKSIQTIQIPKQYRKTVRMVREYRKSLGARRFLLKHYLEWLRQEKQHEPAKDFRKWWNRSYMPMLARRKRQDHD